MVTSSSANGHPLNPTACAQSTVMGADRFDHKACKTPTLDHNITNGNSTSATTTTTTMTMTTIATTTTTIATTTTNKNNSN